MPTVEQIAFWAAIRTAPEDDTPRLAYADWLQEHGDEERAEFIRVQVALAALGKDRRKGRTQRPPLEARERALWKAHGGRWLAPFLAVLKGSSRFDEEDEWLKRLGFRRGFPDLAQLDLEPGRRLAEAGDRLEPFGPCFVADCAAEYDHDRVTAITRWAGAGCLTGLSVSGAGDVDAAAVTRSRSLCNLTHLGLWYGTVGDAGAARVAGWRHAARLRRLDLKDNPITNAGAFDLAASPHLDQLEWIDLSGTRIGLKGRKRLRERFGERLRVDVDD